MLLSERSQALLFIAEYYAIVVIHQSLFICSFTIIFFFYFSVLGLVLKSIFYFHFMSLVSHCEFLIPLY